MNQADRCWLLAIEMFKSEEDVYAKESVKNFKCKIRYYNMEYASSIMKEKKYRGNSFLNSDDPDKERILEYLSAGRLLLSLNSTASLTCRSTSNPEYTRTGRFALIQEGANRHLVHFTDQDVFSTQFGKEAWIYQLGTKVVLTTNFYKPKRKKQEVYLIQFSTTEEAKLFKDCFVKLNYGDCIITELFGPTPVDQLYSRGFPKETSEWNLLQTSSLFELKVLYYQSAVYCGVQNFEQEVPETKGTEYPRNPVASCALEGMDDWISTMKSLLNLLVAKSISFDASEEVTKDISDLDKDVMTLLTIMPFCSCDEESHDAVESMIQDLNSIRWGIAEVKSMQRMNSLYQQAKDDLKQLTQKVQRVLFLSEQEALGEELWRDLDHQPDFTSEQLEIMVLLEEVEELIAKKESIRSGSVIPNNLYGFITEKPTVNMLPIVTKILKSLCNKAADGTLLRSHFKAFDSIDIELRFGKTFAFEHLRETDIEFQKIRATWPTAKAILGEDKVTVLTDEDGELKVVDKFVTERVLDRPDNGFLRECALKHSILQPSISRYADLMMQYLDFDQNIWMRMINVVGRLRKMALPATDAVDDDDSTSDESSAEQSEFEIVPEQSASYERWTQDYICDIKIKPPNIFFDAEIFAAFTNEDLRTKQPIGNGEFGQVFLSKHPLLKEIAVKQFTCADADVILWELETIKKLQENEYVLKLYGFLYRNSEHVGHLPIGYVMEYMPTSLAQVIRSKDDIGFCYQYTLIQALDQVRSMATAFAGLHELNVIHRDIKPDNILINPWMRIRICDFGSFSSPEVTTGQSIKIGTCGYMSPEMVTSDYDAHYDSKTDVYSLGITIWELFHREVPFAGIKEEEIHTKTLNGERPEITSKACMPAVNKLIERCWQHDPFDRPSMKEIEEEADRIYKEIDRQKLRNMQIE